MNLDVLLNSYQSDPRIFKIADRILLSETQKIHLSGLHGSTSQFIINAVFQHPAASKVNHLIILRDAEEAAYFHNTMENISNALNIFYFPSSYKTKKNYRLLNSSHVGQSALLNFQLLQHSPGLEQLSLILKLCLRRLSYQKHYHQTLYLLSKAKQLMWMEF